MKKLKITEAQARELEKLNSKKLLKITKEQYNTILEYEMKSTQMSETKDLFREFIEELYSVNESDEPRRYDELFKVMEVAGLLENNKLRKDIFEGDKNKVKDVITKGLNVMEECGNAYKAVGVMMEGMGMNEMHGEDDETFINKKTTELIKSGKSQEEAERIAKALNDRRKITGVHSHEFGGSKYKKEITPSEKEVTSNDNKQLELPFNESSLYEEVENKGYEGEEILTILGDMPDTVKDAYQNTIKLNVPSFSMISDTQSLRSKEDVKNYIRIFQTKFGATPIFIDITKTDNIFNAKIKLKDEAKDKGYQGDEKEREELKLRGFGLKETDTINEMDSVSVGNMQYDSPAFPASDFFGNKGKEGKAKVKKTQPSKTYPEAKFVKIKEKCKTFPYCNQGPEAIEIEK
jgi:hypothetical protein